jgi:hypothetical protein
MVEVQLVLKAGGLHLQARFQFGASLVTALVFLAQHTLHN